ncbi:MAG: hypothetical protein ACRDRJ_32725 [Streptosporangiaceae bacterium]
MLIVVIALAVAHVLAWAAWGVPWLWLWLWLGLVAVGLFFATGHLGHHHAHQDR